ncbi:MAG TPA: 50S ribosomal protein L17 [Candidatus Marinimicrobia bacterium]|jgi:large subunit ribosomal protein L17|nr:50S ribosomal protein L17 [Candidatus Neomarinimicrobiota bacterium]|tara:strand:- start:463 stop:894 length:432 start_codon:yes stop_codon:yes gene_type:complete
MRHQKKGRKLNRTASHRKALFSNLAASLVIHKKIRTTDAKGKELRTYIERLVTYAKRGDVHGRRLIQKRITGKRGKEIANILIHDIAPAYADRHGGYTRLIKLNNRKNDNAPVTLIEFIDLAPDVTESKDGEVVEEKKGDTKE